jgi:hypothetical protein
VTVTVPDSEAPVLLTRTTAARRPRQPEAGCESRVGPPAFNLPEKLPSLRLPGSLGRGRQAAGVSDSESESAGVPCH